jgi:bifunctional non-homologous end joining protein LigD
MLLRPGLPPAGARDQWALELKWDRMRAQFRVARNASWCLRSRPGRKCGEQFPELAAVAVALDGHEVLLDGELVCLGADGRSRLPPSPATTLGVRRARGIVACRAASRHPRRLDVLHLDGRAVRALRYQRRRELLERTLPDGGRSRQIPAPLTGTLEAVLEVTRAHQLEGIVAKRLDAPYTAGRRSGTWLKHKHRQLETFAVTGWRPAPHRARRSDATFVARATPDGLLRPAGTAELGLSAEERERLRAALHERHIGTRRGAHRVAAGIWVDIDFHGADTQPLRDGVMRAVRVDG